MQFSFVQTFLAALLIASIVCIADGIKCMQSVQINIRGRSMTDSGIEQCSMDRAKQQLSAMHQDLPEQFHDEVFNQCGRSICTVQLAGDGMSLSFNISLRMCELAGSGCRFAEWNCAEGAKMFARVMGTPEEEASGRLASGSCRTCTGDKCNVGDNDDDDDESGDNHTSLVEQPDKRSDDQNTDDKDDEEDDDTEDNKDNTTTMTSTTTESDDKDDTESNEDDTTTVTSTATETDKDETESDSDEDDKKDDKDGDEGETTTATWTTETDEDETTTESTDDDESGPPKNTYTIRAARFRAIVAVLRRYYRRR